MGYGKWSEKEDEFIRQCVAKRFRNRELVEAFRERFGNTRTVGAINKRRAHHYNPVAETPEVLEAPTKPDEAVALELDDETGTVSIAASASIKNPEQLFAKSGLDPDVWEIVDQAPVRKWDVPMKIQDEALIVPCYYVAIKVRKKWGHSSMPQPVLLTWERPKTAERSPSRVFQSVHYSDLHLPFHDERALAILYAILEDVQPDIVVDHGDTIDCQEISKYPKDPARRIALKEEIRMGAEHFAKVTELTPDAKHIWCEGNHEERLKRLIWGLAENRQAGEILTLPQVSEALAWGSLLGLTELGWDIVHYPSHRLLFDKLILTHGEKVRAQSGQSEKAELEHYSKSGLSGHTHRIGYYGKKTYDGQLGWWGLGCLCAIRTHYVSFPNWQQGLAVVVWSEDRKSFAVERVRIFDGVAYFRGRRYTG